MLSDSETQGLSQQLTCKHEEQSEICYKEYSFSSNFFVIRTQELKLDPEVFQIRFWEITW